MRRAPSATRGGMGGAEALAALRALVVANVRYWPTVAPAVRRELARWERPADAIADPVLRRLALQKLSEERFNAELAATLAVLAPAGERERVTRAIVALELLFDYLDGRTERPAHDQIAEGELLFTPFIEALELSPSQKEQPGAGAVATPPDWEYLGALSEYARQNLSVLPAARVVAPLARAGAERCAQAQTRLHAVPALGQEQLRGWAEEHGRESGLGWREYIGGCASSVLTVHALIAGAADPAMAEDDAKRIDAAYLAIGAVITTLDSLVDQAADRRRGEARFIDLFASTEELAEWFRSLTAEALERAREAPNANHNEMTLAGVVAYYTSHPGAHEPHAREITNVVRRALSPTVWPALAVMRGWRAAKTAHAHAQGRRHRGEGAAR